MARFWWVNHKQTAKDEIGGSFLWSPKTKSNGSRNYFYDTMIEAMAGDLVLSYAGGKISHFGVVLEAAYNEQQPDFMGRGGDNWSKDGWFLPVSWQQLWPPVAPKLIWDDISYLFPDKYSPLDSQGNGNQGCYLTEISEPLFQTIVAYSLERNPALFAKAMTTTVGEQLANFTSHRKTTEVARVVRQRIGQLEFRRAVLSREKNCPITGVGDPAFLRASHIKPWRDCENADERLDPSNGLALAPHIDLLFDQGYVSFDFDGCLMLSASCPPMLPIQWNFEVMLGQPLINIDTRRKRYLRHHHKHVYKK